MSIRTLISRIWPHLSLMAAALYLLTTTGGFAEASGNGALGPAFWPRLILIGLIVTSALAAANAATALRATANQNARAPVHGRAAADIESAELPCQPARVFAALALLFGYIAGLAWLGYPVATAFLLVGLFLVGGYRRPAVALIAVCGSLGSFALFRGAVYVSLPLGRGPFLDLSVGLLSLLGIQ
jgi:hypothetical protein